MSSVRRHPVVTRLSQALALAERMEVPPPPDVLDHVRAAIEACGTRGAGRIGGEPGRFVGLSRRHELLAKHLLSRIDPVVTQREVARHCRLSRSHFSRAFKHTTGLSPREWQVRSRLDRVKGLLADPARSIAEIAIHCGFSDQSHLTRVFQDREGVTPARWRRARGTVDG